MMDKNVQVELKPSEKAEKLQSMGPGGLVVDVPLFEALCVRSRTGVVPWNFLDDFLKVGTNCVWNRTSVGFRGLELPKHFHKYGMIMPVIKLWLLKEWLIFSNTFPSGKY